MKRILISAVAVLVLTVSASAQSGLGSILGKIGGAVTSGDSGSLITSITDLISGKSGLTADKLYGTWNYTGSAITFKSSSNALSNLASSAATSSIEKKLDQYLAKVGISQGIFGFTFNQDGTMSVNYGSKKFTGTWTPCLEGFDVKNIG